MKKLNDILEKPYPEFCVGESTIEGILKHPKFYRGHVRTSIGNIYTTDEFKKRSDEVLAKELP